MTGGIVILWIVQFSLPTSICSNLGRRVEVDLRLPHYTDWTPRGRKVGSKTDCCSGTESGKQVLSIGTVAAAADGGMIDFGCCRSV